MGAWCECFELSFRTSISVGCSKSSSCETTPKKPPRTLVVLQPSCSKAVIEEKEGIRGKLGGGLTFVRIESSMLKGGI